MMFGSDMPIDGIDTYFCNPKGERSMYQDYFHVVPEKVDAESYADLIFWQQEALSRQSSWNEVQKLLSQAEKNTPADISALEALQSYYHTGRDYYEGIRENLSAKAQLEWAIGRDL